MFASLKTETVTVPGETPTTVVIHKLSGKDYDAAQFVHMTGTATGRGRNWATRFVALASAGTATADDAKKVFADPMAGFDRLSLVKSGIVSWSCTKADGKPMDVTPEAINDLDDEALELLAKAVLKLTKPALFQTADEYEADQKNG